jgi:hypothetical protein
MVKGESFDVAAAEISSYVSVDGDMDNFDDDISRELTEELLQQMRETPKTCNWVIDLNDLERFYPGEGICPSCANSYASMRRVMWAKKVETDEYDAAYAVAINEKCKEKGLDRGFVEADVEGHKEFLQSVRDAVDIKQFDQVQVRAAYELVSPQKIDAHNIIGQNAIKTSTSKQGGTYAIIRDYYKSGHPHGSSPCLWDRFSGRVDSLIGSGGVMNSAYCRTQAGAQCKICEAVQGEWHILQRCNFLLENPETPLEFVGMQWCSQFLGTPVRAENYAEAREAILSRGGEFITYLEHWTVWQLEQNLIELKRIIEGEKKFETGTVDPSSAEVSNSGAVGSVIRTTVSSCPAIFTSIVDSWVKFRYVYIQEFTEVSRRAPNNPIRYDDVIEGFKDLRDRITKAEILYEGINDRVAPLVIHNFSADQMLHAVLSSTRLSNSGNEAKSAISQGRVKIAGTTQISNAKLSTYGVSGDVLLELTTKKETRTARLFIS